VGKKDGRQEVVEGRGKKKKNQAGLRLQLVVVILWNWIYGFLEGGEFEKLSTLAKKKEDRTPKISPWVKRHIGQN